jgi:hypothetical protein
VITNRLALCLCVLAWPAIGEERSAARDDVTAATDPLAPRLTLSLVDSYVGSYSELTPDSNANQLNIGGTVPHNLFGLPQLLRGTLPFVTSPNTTGAAPPGTPSGSLGPTTGLGDLTVSDLFLATAGAEELAIGAELTVPTATDDRTGPGKWLVGATLASIERQSWGLFGALLSYDRSFAGDGPTWSVLQVQPYITYNLLWGLYARSSATWIFDLEQQTHYIPVGLGVGKVWTLHRDTTLNLFVEPQVSVAHRGIHPAWGVFTGFSSQFSVGSR